MLRPLTRPHCCVGVHRGGTSSSGKGARCRRPSDKRSFRSGSRMVTGRTCPDQASARAPVPRKAETPELAHLPGGAAISKEPPPVPSVTASVDASPLPMASNSSLAGVETVRRLRTPSCPGARDNLLQLTAASPKCSGITGRRGSELLCHVAQPPRCTSPKRCNATPSVGTRSVMRLPATKTRHFSGRSSCGV